MRLGQIQVKLYQIRFELLLMSLISVFALNLIFTTNYYTGSVQTISLILQFIAGFNIIYNRRKIFAWAVFILGFSTITARFLHLFNILPHANFVSILYLSLFASITYEVFREMYRTEVVNRKIVYAAICGIILIGYCGFFVFSAIESIYPGSFKGISEGNDGINDLFYYSFISVMTVGYGDITPMTWVAKNATVLINLISYVYSLIVVSLIVAQFSAHRRRR